MTPAIHRRKFIKNSSAVCVGSCILLSGMKVSAYMWKDDDPIIPEELCYCGYKCPDDCKFYEATVKNDPELKKAVFKEWGMEERHGLSFDPDELYCFKCKPGDNPEGVVLTHCTVRDCAIEKGLEACIQCDELEGCEKELWVRYPDFKKHIIGMQEKYQNS